MLARSLWTNLDSRWFVNHTRPDICIVAFKLRLRSWTVWSNWAHHIDRFYLYIGFLNSRTYSVQQNSWSFMASLQGPKSRTVKFTSNPFCLHLAEHNDEWSFIFLQKPITILNVPDRFVDCTSQDGIDDCWIEIRQARLMFKLFTPFMMTGLSEILKDISSTSLEYPRG